MGPQRFENSWQTPGAQRDGRRNRIALILAVLFLLLAATMAGCKSGATPSDPSAQIGPQKTPGTATSPAPVLEQKPLKLMLSRETVEQGQFIVALVEGAGRLPKSVTVAGFGVVKQARIADSRFVALLPVPATATPGPHTITALATWEDRTEQSEKTINVNARQFAVSRITVSKEQTDRITEEKLRQDAIKVSRAKSQSSPERQWSSGFQKPLEAPVTTAFGLTRYVNGRETWRHSGIDYGAPKGTRIAACADGTVVLATTLNGTGNTVIIDHGLDLFSSYCHMNDIKVKVGDKVKRGQVVGTVGSTGFSTGPHLHWTVSIGSTPIDPDALLSMSKDLEF